MSELAVKGTARPEDFQGCELRVMGRRGDTRIIWDPDNADEVASARSTFDELRAKGFLAFRVARAGKRGEQVSAFDPQAEKLILAPPMAGG